MKNTEANKEKNKYVIYTDASFDNLKKIGTYSVIIQKDNKVLRMWWDIMLQIHI